VEACSVQRDIAVVVDEMSVTSSAHGFQELTTSVREFRLSNFALLRKYDLSGKSMHAYASPLGSYIAETALNGSPSTTIRSMADGHTVSVLPVGGVLAFSGEESRVLTETATSIPTTYAIDIRPVDGGSVLAKLNGLVLWVQYRPQAGDFALALAPVAAGSQVGIAGSRITIVNGAGRLIPVETLT
jgi:hypothetical protein